VNVTAFGTILVSACTLIHTYVSWRVASVPFLGRHLSRQVIIGAGVVLWAIFILGRLYGHGGAGAVAVALEVLGMNWMAVLFLVFVCRGTGTWGPRMRLWHPCEILRVTLTQRSK
jgi:hypothetical protein